MWATPPPRRRPKVDTPGSLLERLQQKLVPKRELAGKCSSPLQGHDSPDRAEADAPRRVAFKKKKPQRPPFKQAGKTPEQRVVYKKRPSPGTHETSAGSTRGTEARAEQSAQADTTMGYGLLSVTIAQSAAAAAAELREAATAVDAGFDAWLE
eukprot:2716229-Prymnesium_polylepis.1